MIRPWKHKEVNTYKNVEDKDRNRDAYRPSLFLFFFCFHICGFDMHVRVYDYLHMCGLMSGSLCAYVCMQVKVRAWSQELFLIGFSLFSLKHGISVKPRAPHYD